MEPQVYDIEAVGCAGKYEQYDYFILAPNIEKRSREFFLKNASSLSVKKTICIDYENFHTALSGALETSFWDDFKGISYTAYRVVDDKGCIRVLSKEKISTESVIGIDITGFSIPAIYEIMNYLRHIVKVKRIDVFYTEPKLYVYEDGYFDSYHGPVKNRTTKVIPGYLCSGKDQREVLAIFLGFDGGLAHSVYSRLAEDGQEIVRTFAINGFPSYMAKLKDVSLFNNESLISQISHSDLLFSTANNPFDVYNVLCEIKAESEDVLLNLCSIGAKPMALGACLFALDNKECVKVTYPYYKKTKFDYKEEPGKIWRYGLTFAS